ncbi:alpha/beta hydrolase [Acidobacteria bacterium AB60]|nr:alpha/beta hydrolase [Acidobacteria bacterium AB60]
MDFDYVVMPAVILVVALLLIWFCIRRMRAISTKDYRPWRKHAERAVLSFLVLLASLLGSSSSLNAIKLYRFRSANPPPGSFYSVDGRKMRINCTGAGSPAIVLEAGSGGDGLVWGGVQPVLSQTTRVCSYDRAGLGWSEPRPGTRDADIIAGELHELLHQAKVTGPVILMGHSVAGLYIRDYASHYPTEVAGIVFVDSVLPSLSRNTGTNVPLIMTIAMRPVFILGVPRLTGACSHPKPGFDASTGILQREDVCHTEYGTCLAELEGRDRSDQQTLNTGPYGDLPVLILSHDPGQRSVVSDQSQEELKKLSARSRRIIAKASGHYIMFDRPDVIEREVPLFVEQIRGTAPWAAAFGSTSAE